MTTPMEKIEKFDENFHHVAGICEVGIDPFRDKEDCNCYKEKFKTYIITTLIEEYEEMLDEVITTLQPKLEGTVYDPYEADMAYITGRNRERYLLRNLIESKIQQWKELLNNK